jgi:hypothetical protein
MNELTAMLVTSMSIRAISVVGRAEIAEEVPAKRGTARNHWDE